MTAVHQTLANENATESSTREHWHAYLVFRLDGSHYAISVDYVGEIITSAEISPVPGAPDYLTGVTNLRGRILPMIDMRKRFQLCQNRSTERDCHVILILELGDDLVELGIQVDAVTEVTRIAPDDIDNAEAMTDYVDKLVFNGVAKTDTGVKLILDAESLIRQLQRDVRRRDRCLPTSSHEDNQR